MKRKRKNPYPYVVSIDWIGDKAQVQALLQSIVGIRQRIQGSGSMLSIPLNDVAWEFPGVRTAKRAFKKLRYIGVRWSPYICLRLLRRWSADGKTDKVIARWQRGSWKYWEQRILKRAISKIKRKTGR